MVELRLKYLNPIVDYFVVVEGNKTWQNNHKKFRFDIKKFDKFKKKIIYVQVDERATERDFIDQPTVTLHCDSMAFMNQACGRIDPEIPIEEGTISWSGDQELGAHAARNLRFTM